jgi:enterochelin esterase-like enzyme
MTVQHTGEVTRIEYRGRADHVRLVTFMPRFPKDLPFRPVGDDLWQLDLELPSQARIEYLIEVESGGGRHVFPDPGNPDTAPNPFGENSVATGPGYRPPVWRTTVPRAGAVTEIRVGSLAYGGRRHHHLYTPPGYTPDSALPLLVVHDGSDYLRYAGLARCLEWMATTGRIPPRRLLLLEPRARHDEYIGSQRQTAHVVEEVVPHVRRRVNVQGSVGLLGASLGAVAAWHVAVAAPDAFDGLFLQSGTFAFDPHPELTQTMQHSIATFVERAEHRQLPMKVAVTCGRYESLIDWNRRVAGSLAIAGTTVALEESWAGHDWGAWADRLVFGLSFLYGHAQP